MSTVYVDGGNVVIAEPAPPQPEPAVRFRDVLPVIYASLLCAGYGTALIFGLLAAIPQPYVTGDTFHGITGFDFNAFFVVGPLCGIPVFTWLAHTMWRVKNPTPEPRDSDWYATVLATNLVGLIFIGFIFMVISLTSLTSADPTRQPAYATWFTGTLKVKPFELPDRAGIVAAYTPKGEKINLDYQLVHNGYTLQVASRVAPAQVTKPIFQLPGASGTVHATDDQGNPLTYTYTRDKTGHYVITIQP